MSSSTETRPGSTPRKEEFDPTAAGTDPTRGIADPGPLGLAAFALTTFVLSLFNAKIAPEALEPVVLPLALFYGGIAQFVAGLWEFRKANTFGATAFTSYGAFWLSYWFIVKYSLPDGPGHTPEHAVATYLLAWGIFTAYMTVASLRVSGAVAAVFVFLTLTFFVLAIGDFAVSSGWTKFGGWLGIITALLAWYASFAGVTNNTWKRTVLPTWEASELGIGRRRAGAPVATGPRR
jgi:succinate-acetate transporter protein